MNLLNYSNFYFVGIKGVAMTSLAQCLTDAGKKIIGTDVKENFVTKDILNNLKIEIETEFKHQLPNNTDCLIYTAAHQGPNNSLVKQAQKKQIPTYSQAEALAFLANSQKLIAVCGVGGKSTTSAMLAWITQQINQPQSFSVGVGNIPGLNKTGQYLTKSNFFITEADEYVIDPAAKDKIIPRFSFLKPAITICTNLKYDHPDVYRNFQHTQQTFLNFFNQIQNNGTLIINRDDQKLFNLAKQVKPNLKIITFGENPKSDLRIQNYKSVNGVTQADVFFQKNKLKTLKLKLPGKFNLMNGVAALAACINMGSEFNPNQCITALNSFKSTMRRAEYIGTKNGVKYYDDYAHHPNEVTNIIKAFKDWFPQKKIVAAFQSHTYSRTKALFDEFVSAFSQADQVLMIDIFASAREKHNQSVSSDQLCQNISKKYQIPTSNLKSIKNLANFFKNNLNSEHVVITIGAGDIYKVHQLI